MARRRQPPQSPELHQAQQRFQQWRQHKQPRERIPQDLWQLALNLVPMLGLNRTARELKIDYYSLKKRVQVAAPQTQPQALQEQPSFLELPPLGTLNRECCIEWDDTNACLRVRFTGFPAHEIAIVSRVLREDR